MRFDEERLGEAFKLIDSGIDKGVFPCAAVAIGDKNGNIKTKIAGNKRIVPYKERLNRESLFDLASLTKVIATNTLVMKMIEYGEITLNDRICDFIPKFTDDGKEDITIFNLLTHTSGLIPHIPFYNICSDYDDSIDYICNEVKLNQVGSVEYSDLNFILLGKILEIICDERIDKLSQEYVFKPLKMNHTSYNPNADDFVPTEKYKNKDEIICGVCHDENARFFGGISGHAGLFSTIDDLIIFANMLLHEGDADGKTFLSHSTYLVMTKDYTNGDKESRGLGWSIKDKTFVGCDLFSEKAFGHTGFTGTSIWTDPTYGVYIILLTNRVHPTRKNEKILRFRRIFQNAVMASIK